MGAPSAMTAIFVGSVGILDHQRPRQLEGPISIGAETHTEQGVLGCEAASRERERGEMEEGEGGGGLYWAPSLPQEMCIQKDGKIHAFWALFPTLRLPHPFSTKNSSFLSLLSALCVF